MTTEVPVAPPAGGTKLIAACASGPQSGDHHAARLGEPPGSVASTRLPDTPLRRRRQVLRCNPANAARPDADGRAARSDRGHRGPLLGRRHATRAGARLPTPPRLCPLVQRRRPVGPRMRSTGWSTSPIRTPAPSSPAPSVTTKSPIAPSMAVCVRPNPLRPLYFQVVEPRGSSTCVESANGNGLLVSRPIYLKLGEIRYVHNKGDFDYCLRAAQEGIRTLITGQTEGSCTGNPTIGAIPRRRPLSYRAYGGRRPYGRPRHFPLTEWIAFCRRSRTPASPVARAHVLYRILKLKPACGPATEFAEVAYQPIIECPRGDSRSSRCSTASCREFAYGHRGRTPDLQKRPQRDPRASSMSDPPAAARLNCSSSRTARATERRSRTQRHAARSVSRTRSTGPAPSRRSDADANLGCKRRVASGLTWVFEQVERRDHPGSMDCVPHPTFFEYCQALLRTVSRRHERVMTIAGKQLPAEVQEPRRTATTSRGTCTAGDGRAGAARGGCFDLDMHHWPDPAREPAGSKASFAAERQVSRLASDLFDRVSAGEDRHLGLHLDLLHLGAERPERPS